MEKLNPNILKILSVADKIRGQLVAQKKIVTAPEISTDGQTALLEFTDVDRAIRQTVIVDDVTVESFGKGR